MSASGPSGPLVLSLTTNISVADFSARIGASAFKFRVHLQVGQVYCVNENKDAKAHFAFFFNFLVFSSVTPILQIWTFFIKVFSSRIMKSLTILSFL